MKSSKRVALFTVLLCAAPVVAQAHPGHDGTGFHAGLTHPMLGLDHVLSMLAAGLWAAQLGGRARWCVPASFVAVMMIGGTLGLARVAVPFVEHGIFASVLILGLLLALAARPPLAASMALVGMFALFHGHAHGAEMPEAAAGLSYGAGFVFATAALHGVGLALGWMIRRDAHLPWRRLAGAAIVLSGAVLFLR